MLYISGDEYCQCCIRQSAKRKSAKLCESCENSDAIDYFNLSPLLRKLYVWYNSTKHSWIRITNLPYYIIKLQCNGVIMGRSGGYISICNKPCNAILTQFYKINVWNSSHFTSTYNYLHFISCQELNSGNNYISRACDISLIEHTSNKLNNYLPNTLKYVYSWNTLCSYNDNLPILIIIMMASETHHYVRPGIICPNIMEGILDYKSDIMNSRNLPIKLRGNDVYCTSTPAHYL
jgi:hypothetical protein